MALKASIGEILLNSTLPRKIVDRHELSARLLNLGVSDIWRRGELIDKMCENLETVNLTDSQLRDCISRIGKRG